MKHGFNLIIIGILLALVIWVGPERISNAWKKILDPSQQTDTASQEQNSDAENTSPAPTPENPYGWQPTEPVQRQAKPTQAKTVYRWTDAAGKVHYGDQIPDDGAAITVDQTQEFNYSNPFQVDIIAVDYSLPLDINHKVELAVSKIFDIYHHSIGLTYRQDPYIKLKLYQDKEAFEQYRDQWAPNLESSVGFYLSQRNEATVWDSGRFENTLKTVTHECSHAILHYQFNRIPAWLDEGLAEYFESMELFGQAVVIHPNKAWDSQLKQLHGVTENISYLQMFIDADYQDWYEKNGEDHQSYAVSWSLVYFLMSTHEGRKTLKALLESFQNDYSYQPKLASNDTDATDHELGMTTVRINDFYYGGIENLHSEWSRWLRKDKSPHRY